MFTLLGKVFLMASASHSSTTETYHRGKK